MDAVVDHVSAPIVPEPVPLIVPAVVRKRDLGRGSEPQVIVNTCGRGLGFCLTDFSAMLVVDGLVYVHLTDHAFTH